MPAREICFVDIIMYLHVKVNLGRVEENEILMRFQMKSPFKYFIGPPNPNPKSPTYLKLSSQTAISLES